MVTDIIKRLVVAVSRSYLQKEGAPRLVLATLSDERHELGILMCAWLAATRRLRTHYLGADCPAREIGRFASNVQATAVLISVVRPESGAATLRELTDLARELPERCEIWLGGAGVDQLATDQLPARCTVLPTAFDFEQRLDLMPHAN
jgi:methanogenic corrinoid protein MtbC1